MFEDMSTDQLESLGSRAEAEIGRLRAAQILTLRRLDAAQVATGDGYRSFVDWVASRLDVGPGTARDLVAGARSMPDATMTELVSGRIGWERAVAETRLAASGADSDRVEASRGLDLAGVRRLASRHRRLTPVDEKTAFLSQHLVVQPSLDDAVWRLWGTLAGVEGRLVEAALHERADALSSAEEGRISGPLRSALALASICQDALDAPVPAGSSGREPVVTVTVDADLAASSDGQAGVEVTGGPRIGRTTLEELLCLGRAEVNRVGGGGVSFLGDTTRTLPARIRRHVLGRDGSCVIDGCRSRYRLEPHHVVPRSAGGTNHPDNLAGVLVASPRGHPPARVHHRPDLAARSAAADQLRGRRSTARAVTAGWRYPGW